MSIRHRFARLLSKTGLNLYSLASWVMSQSSAIYDAEIASHNRNIARLQIAQIQARKVKP